QRKHPVFEVDRATIVAPQYHAAEWSGLAADGQLHAFLRQREPRADPVMHLVIDDTAGIHPGEDADDRSGLRRLEPYARCSKCLDQTPAHFVPDFRQRSSLGDTAGDLAKSLDFDTARERDLAG